MGIRIPNMAVLGRMLARGGAKLAHPVPQRGRARELRREKRTMQPVLWDVPGQGWRDSTRVVLDLTMPPPLSRCFNNVPGRGRVKSRIYRAWIKGALASIAADRIGRVDGRVRVTVAMRRDHAGKGADADNRLKALGDILTKAGIIRDDKHIGAWAVEWSEAGPSVQMTVSAIRPQETTHE